MIENIELLAFIKENISLARTIVIKNEDLAILDNTLMYQYQKITPSADKSKWRYYLNLNGEYHSTDEMMTVRSLDDNENIEFTKTNLELHPATKKAYRLGSYYFSRLVALYPHQMELIQGIINPIPPEESIPAKNYQILRYTKDYVQWNESQLIPELQKHIDQVVYQSFSTEYKYTDDLMLPLLIAHLHESIFKFLLQCRFEHRYSRYAHNFYIWSHLQSRGISPIYKDLLNNKQTMWLFRNIDYVLRNLGKESTFKELINILLTERNIPIAKYDLIQSTENITTDLHSEPLFYTERLNLIETRGLGQSVNKLAITMLKEIPEALDNELYYDSYLPDTEYDFTYGESTTFPTKILDSELVDTTTRKPETIYNVLMNELIYLSGEGLYNINLDIEDPLSGIHQRISVKDAVVLWHHLLNSYNGASCDNIPEFYYKDVLRKTPPTVDTMLSVGAKPFLTEEWCKDALKLYIPQIRMVSPSVFYENSLNIFNLKWKHKKMYSRWLSIGYHSRRKNAISTMYKTGFMKLTDKKSYAEFLEQYDFDFSSYRQEDYFALMWEIWKKATGWDQFSHITVGQIQEGMIGLMRFLSSYTVQYIHQTKIESGWYEGGIDLFTENPSLLNPNRDDGQPELENDVESSRIPIHHRVVMIKNEEEETLYLDAQLYAGTLLSELEMDGDIYETPKLYPVELADTDKDDGFHASQVMDIEYKLRNFTGELPYNLEDLIPTGGSNYDKHTLKELIVDTFEGITKSGPWEAIGIKIVNNKLDNENVADQVEGYTYEKLAETKSIDEDTNRYYVGFSPKETGESVIKLDIVIRNTETEELSAIRFDYNTVTKQNTWAISFEIPQSITLNVPFEITPTITGLMLGRAGDIKEKYVVDDTITEYLAIDDDSGKPMGTFLKEGWPEELPVLYIMTTTQGGDDPEASLHTYFMKGLIPSDRYYDPLTDPEFEPKIRCNEADPYAITLENFSLAASSHGWEPTNLYLKKDEDGQYPAELVKTDYNGITDFLSPTLSTRKYVDETVDDKVIRTFEWYYAIATETPSLNMVIELTSQDDGRVVLKEFTYSPKVIDHGAQCELSILPEENFKFGINYSSETTLTVSGLSENIELYLAENPVIIPNQEGKVAIDYFSDRVENNKVYSYSVRPYEEMTQDLEWAVKLEGMVKALNGEYLIIQPYATFTILKSDVVDYDVINIDDVQFKGWDNNTIHAHAIIPSRYMISDFTNGWVVESAEVIKTNEKWPEFVGTVLPGQISQFDIKGFDPYIKVGKGVDGNQSVPEGYTRWFTLYMLGNRDYLANQHMNIAIPIKLNLSNKYSGKTGSIEINPKNVFNGEMFVGSAQPDELWAGNKNHVVPTWESLPLPEYDGELTSTEGIFLGVDKYKGGEGYTEVTTAVWNDDNTADITMPKAPLNDGDGIRIYNKRTYTTTDSEQQGSSIADIVYYPYIDYAKDQILRVAPPTYEELDFTPLGNVDFYQGVRSSYVTLVNTEKAYENSWKITSINLEKYGTDEQDDLMITAIDGKDLTSAMYINGVQSNAVDDAPDGKSKYASAYVGFVPAKEGKQTVGVIVTFKNSLVAGIAERKYRYEFEIDVKPNEGNIIFDSSYPDPWWLMNEDTYALTDLINITGDVNRKELIGAGINNQYADYLTVSTGILSTLSSSRALDVKILKEFDEDVNPKAIVYYNVYLNGYNSTDVRRVRYYFDSLSIRGDRIYTDGDITLDMIGFGPDVTFNPMRQNESYTERFVYNMNSRGWTVRLMRLQENQSWMNHYFIYDNQVFTDNRLGRFTSQDITIDRDTKAPDGKYYYLPRYGGRVAGDYDVNIQISLVNNNNAKTTTKLLNYKTSRTIEESDIKLNLTYDNIYIGKQVQLLGGIENIPSDDLHNGMVSEQYYFNPVGSNKKYFTLYKTNPKAILTSETYPVGEGKGIMLAMAVPYDQMKSGIMETETWIRAYRGEQIIPDSDIVEYVAFPEQNDIDFTPLDGVDFYQGVRSTYLTLYNPTAPNEVDWWISNVDLTVKGTADQDTNIITKINDVDLGELTYKTAYGVIQTTDIPEGKENYLGITTAFVPAKTGKQTFDVTVTVTVNTGTTTRSKDYHYEIEIDVKVNNSNVVYDNSYSDPDWVIGESNYVLIDVEGITDDITDKVITYVTTTTTDAQYITPSIDVNTALSSNKALVVKVPKVFKDINPNVIIAENITLNGYDAADPRGERYYYGVLPVKADKLYSLDDVTLETIEFTEDVIWENKRVNESYYDRYIYNIESKGWTVKSVGIIENANWMNNYFEYGADRTRTPFLINTSKYNVKSDLTVIAPAGKQYYLPFYGSRKEGAWITYINVFVVNNHLAGGRQKTLSYRKEYTYVASDIKLNFTNESFIIGKNNKLTGGMEATPSADIHTGMILGSDGISLKGDKSSFFNIYKTPYSLDINSNYVEGSGNGIRLMVYQVYNKMQNNGVVESNTWIRGYRGQQNIPEEQITAVVEYPEASEFDFTPLTSDLIQGVVCTVGYMYNAKAITAKGWNCVDKGLAVYGKDNQSDVMIDNIEGRTFDDGYLYSYGQMNFVPSDAPSNAKDYQYGYVRFVPAKTGKQTVDVTVSIQRGSTTSDYTFPVEIDVKANEGTVTYSSKNAEPWYFLDYGVTLETELSGYSGTLTEDTFSLAAMIPRDESYFTVTLNTSDMTVTSIKDVEDIDRGLIVGHTVTVSGYDANDKRAIRSYYDIIWIDNTHVYSLDNLKPALVDMKTDVIFEEMEQYTSYVERYSYLRTPLSGWSIDSTRIVEDKDTMNHVFIYGGDTSTSAQLFTGGRYRLTSDKNINAPADRFFSLPSYGYRELGTFEVIFEIAISTTQFGSRKSGVIQFKQTRKVVDGGIKLTATYDTMKAGQANKLSLDRQNIPRPDIKPGVISAATTTNRTGKNYSFFTYRSPNLTIGSGYPVGSGSGIMLGFIYPYSARQAGADAPSETDNRFYRCQVIIPDSDIS